MTEIKELIGKTMKSVRQKGDDELLFETDDGKIMRFYHSQDCCETVSIEDIVGDLDDLVGSPIIQADEETYDENPDGIKKEYQDSFTWTFYKFATNKGSVTVRWYGESNGYYSESVDWAWMA